MSQPRSPKRQHHYCRHTPPHYTHQQCSQSFAIEYLEGSVPPSAMASPIAVPPISASLNPEPSQPTDRKENHLPPKSYADAVEENLDSDGQVENRVPMQYIGNGIDDAPRSPMRKVHKRNGSVRVNGVKKEKEDKKVIVEDFQDRDGERLTTVNFSKAYEEALRQDEREKPIMKQSALVSGRKAGAGWERSGYMISLLRILWKN